VIIRSRAQAVVERVERTPIGKLDVDTWLEATLQIQWWARQRTPQSVKISFLLLERLASEQQALSSGGYNDVSLFLNGEMLHALILNWQQVIKKSVNDATVVISPQKLVFKLDKLCENSPSLKMPGTGLSLIIDATLHLCKRVVSLEAAAFCEVLWERLVDKNYSENRSSQFQPDIFNFNSVLSAWVSCGHTERAHDVFDRVPRDVVTPNNHSYNILLSAYAKERDGPAAERLLELMCRQWQLQQERVRNSDERSLGHEQSLEMIRPDVVTWTTVINAWAKSSSPDAAGRAQALLNRMSDPSNALSVPPDLMTLNTVLLCWSRSSTPDSPDRCLALLQKIKDLYATGKLKSPPNSFSYARVIYAYVKAGRPSDAHDIFEEMYRGFMHDGHTHLKPELQPLTSLLSALGSAGQVERAWAVLGRIRELHDLGVLPTGPDLVEYNIMIDCLLSCHDALPDCAVKAYTLLQEIKKNPKTQPDMRLYAFALKAWLLTPDGLDRAVELAREALDVYSEGCESRSSTEYRSIEAIILAFSTTGHPVHAENILFEVSNLARENRCPPPDEDVFGSLVDSWKKSKDPEAVLHLQDLVENEKHLPISGAVRDGSAIRSRYTV
jgi:pentatricopeptide repeat protein